MSLAILTLLPVLAGLGLIYWSSVLEDEQAVFKLFLQILFLPLLLLSINFGVIDARLLYGADSELVVLLAQFAYYVGWVIFIVGAYLFFKLGGEIKDWFIERKARRESEKYD